MKPQDSLKVKVEFIEPVLGTLAGDPEIATEFILARADRPKPDEQEVLDAMETDAEAIEKSATVFPKENGVAFCWDYQWKGFFKEACLAMIESEQYTKESLKKNKLTAYTYKRSIDKLIFPEPRKIFFNYDTEAERMWTQRPLRAETMRGPRIALAISETLPAGTTCEFAVACYNKRHMDFVREWLDYGKVNGTLQWRNGGYGRFTWSE